ncbi:MAG: PAS domain S-box protein [Thermodesulfobacteriota bacterium]|nr:PAS domain S-box protein [Thermodesulfobacteriota bacterium]
MKTEDLLDKRKDYQALVQSVTDYVFAVNRNYRIIMTNDLFNSEFGATSGDFCYKAWKNREEKCEGCMAEQAFQTGQAQKSEEMVMMKDGRATKVLVNYTPVKDEKGNVIYVLETATDINEEKNLQENLSGAAGDLVSMLAARLVELQKSEEKYRTIFERSRDAIFLSGPNARITDINQAGVEILGYESKEEVLALKSAYDLFENRDFLRQFQEKVLRDGFVTEFETSLVRKDGRAFDALVTSNVITETSAATESYVFIITDITKIKQAHRKIEKRNIRLATLNAISTTVSSTLDLKKVLKSTIDKILEILEPDSMRIYLFDEKNEVLNLVAHKGLSYKFIKRAYIKRRKVGDGPMGHAALSGETRVVDNYLRSTSPYVDLFVEEGLKSTAYIPLVSKGKPVGVMCVSSHTEFKFSANYMKFLTAIGNQIGMAVENANLYEHVKKAYEELKEAQEQVIRTEKLASLGKLAATVAHEINNPLAAVLTYIRLMIKLIARGSFTQEKLADISRYLDTMESETARCGEIVKNLLAFSRRSAIHIKSHSIEKIVDKTLELIIHDLEMKGIQMLKEFEPDLPEVRCDFKQIQQAFLNLIGNASEAMSGGGVLSLTVRALKSKGVVEVMFSDTGVGISDSDQMNIFEPFFTTKEEGKGVGLGLSVVYGIVARHNGSVDVKSEIGKGSSFKVRLPIA